MEPVIGSATLLTLEANNSPSCCSGLSKVVTNIRVSCITINIVLRLHNNIPEQRLCLLMVTKGSLKKFKKCYTSVEGFPKTQWLNLKSWLFISFF